MDEHDFQRMIQTALDRTKAEFSKIPPKRHTALLEVMIRGADVAIGVYLDASIPRGWDSFVIKGEAKLVEISDNNTAASLKLVAIPCRQVEVAAAMGQLYGDLIGQGGMAEATTTTSFVSSPPVESTPDSGSSPSALGERDPSSDMMELSEKDNRAGPLGDTTLPDLLTRGWTRAMVTSLLDDSGTQTMFLIAKVREGEKSAAFRSAILEAGFPNRPSNAAVRAYDQIRAGVCVKVVPFPEVLKFVLHPSSSAYPHVERYLTTYPDVPRHQLIADIVIYHASRTLTNVGKHLDTVNKTQGMTALGKHARALVTGAVSDAYPELKVAYQGPSTIIFPQDAEEH